MRSQTPRATFYAGTGRLQCFSLTLTAQALSDTEIAALTAELARNGLPFESDDAADPIRRLFELTIGAHAAILREADYFFPEAARIILAQPAQGKFTVAVPKIPTGATLSSDLFVSVINQCSKAARGDGSIDRWIKTVRHELATTPKLITTAAHIARAAYELEMPLIEWRQPFLQIGYAKNGIVVSGSITQFSPSIGVHFAREKTWANELLASAGLPVARGELVKDVADARETAARFGYPVVIKPADRDGGAAVSSGITGPAELEQAFHRARAVSENVLLEKHIDGLDYRLLFFHDQLLNAIERTPGGVTGNGRDTIAQLLEETNRERAHEDSILVPLVLDDEARVMLQRHALTLETVPAKGQFVSLRRAANHALGGGVRKATDIHPDNLDLAKRAMKLLRLDIAGLDLILPDISKSWHETGGVVCEVNAQPFIGEPIGRDFYKDILLDIVPEGGRIPIVLVIGTLDAATVAALVKSIPGLAVTDSTGTLRDGRPLAPKDATWPHAVQTALYDQETTAVLCQLFAARPAPPLSPVDRFDAALVLETPAHMIPALTALLGRAKQVHAIDPAALKAGGIKAAPIAKGEVKAALAALLSGKPMPKAASPKPAPRGKAPPASRKLR